MQFHNHPEAWNALLFGRKRWFLMPYDHLYDWHERKRWIYGFGMKTDVEAFLRNRYGEPHVAEHAAKYGYDCIQEVM